MDVFEVRFRGEPAVIIQWTLSGFTDSETAVGAIDAMWVSKRDFRVLARIEAAPGERTWAGSYVFTHHQPDRTLAVLVEDNGKTTNRSLERVPPVFDFATFGYLLPFLRDPPRSGFQLQNTGGFADLSARNVALLPGEPIEKTDAYGRDRSVKTYDLLTASGAGIITIEVSDEPPFFWGWTFRRVADGSVISRVVYRSHSVT